MVVFDKTGTLTKGIFEVTDVISLGSLKKEELLMYAASIEMYSKHSIAEAIVKEAKKRNNTFFLRNIQSMSPVKESMELYRGKLVLAGTQLLLLDKGFTPRKFEITKRSNK